METYPDDQPTQELKIIDPARMEYEVVIAHLERARELWLPDYHKAIRDNHMNAELNAKANRHMPNIDKLLGELSLLDYKPS